MMSLGTDARHRLSLGTVVSVGAVMTLGAAANLGTAMTLGAPAPTRVSLPPLTDLDITPSPDGNEEG